MDFADIEQAGKDLLAAHPGLRHGAKSVYHRASYLLSKEKVKCEGAVERVSPDDGYEYFYGYYDKSPWSADERYMLCMRAECTNKSVAPVEPIDILVLDTRDGYAPRKIGTSRSWSVQQGAMAQWLGPDFNSRVIYNDFRDGAYMSVVVDVESGAERVLPRPVYAVAPDGSFALTLDFSRLHRLRPGYGYSNLPDATEGQLVPGGPCVWKVDLATGVVEGLFDYADFAGFDPRPEMEGAEHKVNHLMINPSGTRFMVLHRWFKAGKKYTRLVTGDCDGGGLFNLSDDDFVSHCYWKSDDEIISFMRRADRGNHYYLFKDGGHEYKLLWPSLKTDGHCSYSPDGSLVVTDTYPNRHRLAYVYLCREDVAEPTKLATVFAPFSYDFDTRCDLHPRWDRRGEKICFDSVHEGKRRLYVVPVKADVVEAGADEKIFNRIMRETEGFQVVSFDIFDTLVKRDVANPRDVFTIAGDLFERRTGRTLKNFREARIAAEREVREESSEEEITLDQIYRRLSKSLELNQGEADELARYEVEAELELCHPNAQVVHAFKSLLAARKTVVITSNMYFPLDTIERILNNAGVTGYSRLFLSCDKGLSKKTGNLFKAMMTELGVDASQVVHVGDSWKADYLPAKRLGIKAVHLAKGYPMKSAAGRSDADGFADSVVRGMATSRLSGAEDPYYIFGYRAFGILLYGFCRWLKADLAEKDIDKVFFFSRDGHVIKRAFDIMNNDGAVDSHYFYVSRRSLRIPQLWLDPEYDSVLKTFPFAKLLNVDIFLQNLGLNAEDYVEDLERLGLKPTDELRKSELPESETMKALYDAVKDDAVVRSKSEYDAFMRYAKQEGFAGKVAVVDIGWHGSLQLFIKNMAEELSMDLDMEGYYIGLATAAREGLSFQGYVVDEGNADGRCDAWKPFNGLVESLFLAQEGSTERFEVGEDGVSRPILFPYEYENGVTGGRECEAVLVAAIQDGAIAFVRDLCESGYLDQVPFSSTFAFSYIAQTGRHPSKRDLAMFGGFRFMEERVDRLAQPEPLVSYAMHPKRLKNDLGYARWKIGFLKKLVKLPLPYTKIYGVLRKAVK